MLHGYLATYLITRMQIMFNLEFYTSYCDDIKMKNAKKKKKKLMHYEGYMKVGIPLAARILLINRSVPYQLKPGVSWPMRGR